MLQLRHLFLLLLCLLFSAPLFADIVVEPDLIEDALNTGETNDHIITISNDGDEDLIFEIDYEVVSEPERDNSRRGIRSTASNYGPRRDEVDLDGMMFAVFQDRDAWGMLDQTMIAREPLLELGENVESFRDANDWNEVDFGDFDAIIVVGSQQGYGQQYNENYDRFCEYVDGGGSAYYENGDMQEEIHSPGWITNNTWDGDQNGRLMVSPDPRDENYSLFAEICQESQGEDLWNEGHIIIGSSWTHSGYQTNQFEQDEMIEWYQVIADGERSGVPGAVAYGYGSGTVLTMGGPVAFNWEQHDIEGRWGSIAAEILYYLTEMSGAGWLAIEPTEGSVAPGQDFEVFVHLDAAGLYEGAYEADIHVLSDDEAAPDIVVGLILTVTGAPDIDVIWDEDYGYPEMADWNEAYPDVFNGHPYVFPFMIENIGTADLVVDWIDFQGDGAGVFTGPDDIDVIGPGEELEMEIVLESAETGTWEAELIIASNDPDQANYIVPLRGETGEPPIIDLSTNSIEVDLNTGEIAEATITVANEGEAPLRFEIDAEIISEPERDADNRRVRSTQSQFGPRRDEVDLDGMMFAVIQDQDVWGYLDATMMQNEPLLEQGENYVSFRNGNAWSDIVFEDYDAIIYAGNHQTDAFVRSYNENIERFAEWIADGGCAYSETADMNAQITPVGGFRNDSDGDMNGTLVVSPDPGDDNYSLFAEICQESQPDYWNEGETIEGSSWLHASYSLGQFENAVEDGTIEWYQNLATPERNQNTAGAIAYGYGSGAILLVSHPIGHCWQWFAEEGQWGSIAAEILYYLTEVTGSKWLAYEPAEGILDRGAETDIFVTLDAAGLFTGAYEADLHFLSNDPDMPDAVVNVIVNVTGAPDIYVEWPEAIGFPDVIDWNEAYLDLFSGGPYDIPVEVSNEGTDVLIVSEVSSNHDYFTVNVENEFQLQPNESTELIFTFNAPAEDPGEYEAIVTFTSNDPDQDVLDVALMAHAFLPPIIGVRPNSIEDELNTGETAEHMIDVSNNGDALLRVTTDIEIIQEPDNDRDHASRAVRSVGPARSPARDRRSEPDDMNYEWRDNLEDDGPEFEWIDITEFEETQEFRLGDDQNTGAIELGWTFPFWDREFEQVFIDSDGWMSFTWGGQDIGVNPGNYPMQANGRYENTVALLNTDFWEGTEVWFWSNQRDEAVISWAGDHRYMYQLLLYDTGLAVMQYGDNVDQRGGEVGVNLGDGEHGWFISQQDPNYIAPGRAIGFGPAQGWITWVYLEDGYDEFTVEAGGNAEFTLFLDAAGLITGVYEASLMINSNDPAAPLIEINVSVDVTGAPDIYVEWPDEIGFPEVINWNDAFLDVFSGGPYDIPIIIENVGTDVLIINDIYSDNEYFTPNLDEAEVEIGEEQIVVFTFNCPAEDPGDFNAVMTIESNDPDEDVSVLAMHAEALSPPIAVIGPNAIEVDLNTGETAEDAINIANEGQALLRFNIDSEIISEPERDSDQRTVRSTRSQVGPRRDEVDLDGMMFAVLQDQDFFGFLDDNMMGRDPLLERGENYVSFRNGEDWNEIEFEDYDAIVYAGNFQSDRYTQAYNNNQERFAEWIADGGCAYSETGDMNAQIQPPGGFRNDQRGGWQGTLVVSPDPDAENYSLFAEICHESQPNFWNEGQRLEGEEFLSSSYSLGQFDQALDEGMIEWYQQIAVPDDNPNNAGVVSYGYGNGVVMLFGHPVGQCWQWFAEEGMWGSIAAEILYYLTELNGSSWLVYEPTEGTVEPGGELDVFVLLDAAGLFTGTYEAEMHIFTNDPAAPEVIISVIINATGAPDIVVEWPDEAGFPDEVNWNEMFPNVFFGGGYPIPVMITNDGTDDLVVDDISCDEGVFTCEPSDFVLGYGEELEVNFILNTDEAGEYAGTMLIASNDPDQGEIEIHVTGESTPPPVMVVAPQVIEAGLLEGQVVESAIEMANEGAVDLVWTSDSEIIREPERDNFRGRNVRSVADYAAPPSFTNFADKTRSDDIVWSQGHTVNRGQINYGPRRDPVPEDPPASMFALFQQTNPWGYDLENIFQSVDGLQYVRYRSWNDEFDLGDFDAIWVGNYEEDNWNATYNDNLEIIEDWVDHGGAYYMCTGTNNFGVIPVHPGGLERVEGYSNTGRTAVDPEECYLFEMMEWERGTALQGNWFNHCNYPQDRLENIDNSDEVQVLVRSDDPDNGVPVVVRYTYGRGQCVVSGSTDGYLHSNPNEYLWGQAGAAMLHYLDHLANYAAWLSWDPEEGSIEPGMSENIRVTLNSAGLFGGEYEAELYFYSNDPVEPADVPDATVSIVIEVTGQGRIYVEPGGTEEGNTPADFGIVYIGYPETITATLENVGTDVLIVENIEGTDVFYIDEQIGFPIEINAGETMDLPIIFNPQEHQEGQEATLIATTNDGNWEEGYPIQVVGDGLTAPVIDVSPAAIEETVPEGEIRENDITVSNQGGSLLTFDTDFEVISEPERDRGSRSVRSTRAQVGPRRDDFDLEGKMFAVIQDQNIFGWLDETMMDSDPLLDRGENFVSFRNANEWNDIDFEEYDAIVYAGNFQSREYTQAYNDNFERFAEWIADGGCAYSETADMGAEIRPVGGFNNDRDGAENGILRVSPDPGAENYSLFAEICHESQPQYWEDRELLEGGSFLHSSYSMGQFNNALEEGVIEWYQMIASSEWDENSAGVVAYGYGAGAVMLIGHPVGHCWQWYNQEGMWGSIASEILYYLTEVGGVKWFEWDPADGEIEPDAEMDINTTIITEGLNDGLYVGSLMILSNDPETPSVEVAVTVEVEGQSFIVAEPMPQPFEDAVDIQFPNAYMEEDVTAVNVTLMNRGSLDIVISNVEVTGDMADDFSTDIENDTEIPARGEIEATFFFDPAALGDRSGRIILHTDAMNVENGDVWWDVSGLGQIPPNIWVDPPEFAWAVMIDDDPMDDILTIGNNDEEFRRNLEFEIEIVDVEVEEEDGERDAVRRSVRAVGPQRINPARDRRAEPDDMGYEWRDNLEEDGPVYEWIDIQGMDGVQEFRLGDDQNTGEIELGWIFPFWDREFDRIFVDSDGWMSFTYGGRENGVDPRSYPAWAEGWRENTVAIHNTDHWEGNIVWVYTDGDGFAGIEWAGNGWIRYQLLLFDNGYGVMQYGDNVGDEEGAGVGINLGDGEHGWFISEWEREYIRNGRAIGFGPARAWSSWLTADPMEGSIPAGELFEVVLTIDASELEDEMDYFADLIVSSNDPGGDVTVPCHLRTGLAPLRRYPNFVETEAWHTLTIEELTFNGAPAPINWEIGVFTPQQVLAGAIVWPGNSDDLYAYGAVGEDPGFVQGNRFEFKVWDEDTQTEYHAVPEYIDGIEVWDNGAVTSLNLRIFTVSEITMHINAHWNLISINVDPRDMYGEDERGPDIRTMWAELGPDGADQIVLLKNGRGLFWAPAWGFINIPYWNLTEGYQINLREESEITLNGDFIPPNRDIPLNPGWNMIAYFPNYDLDASSPDFYVLSPIIDMVSLAKDVIGRFISTEFGFSNMQPWTKGQGYQVRLEGEEQVILNYPPEQDGDVLAALEPAKSQRWIEPAVTNANMSILIHAIAGLKSGEGDQIAAYSAAGLLLGCSDVVDGQCGLAVWGDDECTDAIDGASAQETFVLKYWDADRGAERDLAVSAVLEGKGLTFGKDNFTVLDVNVLAEIPAEYYLAQNYPNPFNSMTRLAYGMPENDHVSIQVFDISGRLVNTLVEGDMNAGHHVAVWNSNAASAGVYIVRMSAGASTFTQKIMLVK